MNEDQQNAADAPELPPKLQEELKALYAPPRLVPSHVDDAIMAQARGHLATIVARRRTVPFPRWLAAAAAIVLLTVAVSWWFAARPSAVVAREDINRDGRVDILDAFGLARRLQQGAAHDPRFDIDGNGVVNQKDIDLITTRAVKLAGRQG